MPMTCLIQNNWPCWTPCCCVSPDVSRIPRPSFGGRSFWGPAARAWLRGRVQHGTARDVGRGRSSASTGTAGPRAAAPTQSPPLARNHRGHANSHGTPLPSAGEAGSDLGSVSPPRRRRARGAVCAVAVGALTSVVECRCGGALGHFLWKGFGARRGRMCASVTVAAGPLPGRLGRMTPRERCFQSLRREGTRAPPAGRRQGRAPTRTLSKESRRTGETT